MKVNNINGTSDNTCKCASWLEHRKKFSGEALPTYCPETNCIKKPDVGAHVQKDGSTVWSIIPLCKDHNAQKGKSLSVGDWVTLVSANVSQTCGKS